MKFESISDFIKSLTSLALIYFIRIEENPNKEKIKTFSSILRTIGFSNFQIDSNNHRVRFRFGSTKSANISDKEFLNRIQRGKIILFHKILDNEIINDLQDKKFFTFKDGSVFGGFNAKFCDFLYIELPKEITSKYSNLKDLCENLSKLMIANAVLLPKNTFSKRILEKISFEERALLSGFFLYHSFNTNIAAARRLPFEKKLLTQKRDREAYEKERENEFIDEWGNQIGIAAREILDNGKEGFLRIMKEWEINDEDEFELQLKEKHLKKLTREYSLLTSEIGTMIKYAYVRKMKNPEKNEFLALNIGETPSVQTSNQSIMNNFSLIDKIINSSISNKTKDNALKLFFEKNK